VSGATVLRSVFFDCDSTLSRIEGVDELTRRLPAAERAEIKGMTEAAMNGELPLHAVYAQRLAVVAPTAAEVAAVGELYVAQLVPGAAETVAALRALGKTVGIVSGGLLGAVRVLARHLGIADAHVHAVALHHDARGQYLDYDRGSPLSRNDGKRQVLAGLPAALRPLAFVGDGVTDLEAAPAAERFVGFGGVARREAVARAAERYVGEPDLRAVLPHLLTTEELAQVRYSASRTIDPGAGNLPGSSPRP
jgi:phosphoserine phosphatase